MSEVKMLKGASELGKLVYERDGDGQLKKTTTSVLPGPASSEHKYDENNRLTEDNKQAYEYDKANSPTKLEGAGTYSYDEADQLKEGPTATYAYNEDGRRTESKPKSGEPATKYSYDQAGNLTAVERAKGAKEPEIKDSYTYDGTNLRQSQTIGGTKTNLTWDRAEGLPLVLSDETNSYIYGPGGLPVEQISSGGTTLYLHHDQQGSTRLLTNTSGNTETAYTYNPYGTLNATTGTASTPLRYDGEYANTDTGLIYLRARTYDPGTAQFLTIDPALETAEEPYSYTKDNPENSTDPTGECQQPNPQPPNPICMRLERELNEAQLLSGEYRSLGDTTFARAEEIMNNLSWYWRPFNRHRQLTEATTLYRLAGEYYQRATSESQRTITITQQMRQAGCFR